MRKRFPALWILQLLLLLGTGLSEMFIPRTMLEGYLGQESPEAVEWPDPELNRWAIGLQEISAPPPEVVAFFARHEVAFEGAGVWSADDPGSEVITAGDRTRWDATIEWILSARPSLSEPDQAMVVAWLRAVDQANIPSAELLRWIESTERPERPHSELIIWITGMDQVDVETWTLAADSVRQESPYILAAALFTFFGLLNPRIRRALARIFTLIFVLWTVMVVYGHQPAIAGELLRASVDGDPLDPALLAEAKLHGQPSVLQVRHLLIWAGVLSAATLALTFVRSPGRATSLALFTFLAFWCGAILWFAPLMPPLGLASLWGFTVLALVNGFYWLVVKSESPPQDDAGIAEGRPPQLWTLWFVQFVFLFTAGVIVLLFPNWVFGHFTVDSIDHLTTTMVDDQLRFSGAWIIAMSLFSYAALGAAEDRTWRAIGYIFICSFALFAFSNLLNISSGEYSVWAYAFSFQGVIFIPSTYHLLRRSKSPWARENVERESDYPTLPGLWAAARMTPWLSGRRGAFRHGVGAAGRLVVLPEVRDLPPHDFFVAGSRFSALARFSNCTSGDDAALDVRGAALRLHDRLGLPVLELVFATGSFALASNLIQFLKVLPRSARDGKVRKMGRRLRRRLRADRELFEGFAAGLRRAPQSFTALTYDHQVTRHWITPDCDQWLCRLRLRPLEDPDPEEIGRPDAEDLEALWQQERRGSETRATDYLREEFKARLGADERPVLQLEVQLHRLLATDSLEWYDSTVEWRESEHPWRPLARLELRSALTAREAEGLRFDPGRGPRSLSIPKSTGPWDPRSIGAAQARVMRFVSKCRLWRRPPAESLQVPPLSEENDANQQLATTGRHQDGL